MATTTLNGLKNSNTATVTYSVTRSSTSNAYVTVTMSISIYNGYKGNNWSSPTGNGRFGANVGTWNSDTKNWNSYTKVGSDWGGMSLNYGATKTIGPYSASVYWPYSSTMPLGVYIDYHAGGWGPTANTAGLRWTINASVPTYATWTATTGPTAMYRSPNPTYYGDTVTLRWEGCANGTNNTITGYRIEYSYNNWSTYSTTSTLNTTAGSGSLSFTCSQDKSYVYRLCIISTKTTRKVTYNSFSLSHVGDVSNIQYIRSEENNTSGSFNHWVDRVLKLKWTSATGAQSYQVMILRPDNDGWYTNYQTYSTSSTSITINLPTRSVFPGPYHWNSSETRTGHRFYVQVRSVRSGKYGEWIGNDCAIWRSAAVRIRNGSSWSNGSVYVYHNGWKLARELYVRSGSTWQYSKRY